MIKQTAILFCTVALLVACLALCGCNREKQKVPAKKNFIVHWKGFDSGYRNVTTN
jgi:hypothetical protein